MNCNINDAIAILRSHLNVTCKQCKMVLEELKFNKEESLKSPLINAFLQVYLIFITLVVLSH